MELKDLFVSHKLVEPVSMEYLEPVNMEYLEPIVPFRLYLNLPRVKLTLSQPEEKAPSTITVDWLHEEMKDDIYKPNDLHTAYLWVLSAINQGISLDDAIALAGHVYSESKFNNNAVNDTELRGTSINDKTHGWANAGEGLILITHWNTKKKMIEKYNDDPNREGDEISTDENIYSRPDSRHISSVNMNDAILFVKYFYEDRLNKGLDFEDLVSDFYLQKAGRGYFKEGTLIDRAYRTGEKYRKFNNHNYNAFIQSLRFSTELKKMFNNG